MSLVGALNNCFGKYPHDSYCFCYDEQWGLKARGKHGPPSEPGVYIFLRDCVEGDELEHSIREADPKEFSSRVLYIGKAGTFVNGNRFKSQKLLERISRGKQFGRRRSVTIPIQMHRTSIKCITILWFVTCRGAIRDLPAHSEAVLMQEYWNDTGYVRLPIWNKEY